MGITGLWEVIKGEDHSVPIAELTETHFKRHGRPLRIAVDEADWRFNNLTPQQVYMIRESKKKGTFIVIHSNCGSQPPMNQLTKASRSPCSTVSVAFLL